MFYLLEATIAIAHHHDLVVRTRIRDAAARTEKRNHIQRIEMSSVDHRNGMNETADAVAIAPIIARKRRNNRHQRLNPNRHRMTVHSVRSRATFRHPIARGTNDQRHQVMQMVWTPFLSENCGK